MPRLAMNNTASFCAVSGCSGKPTGYHTRCPKHHHAYHTHGHELQKPVRIKDLRSQLRRLESYAKTSGGASALKMIEDQYVRIARGAVADFEAAEARTLETGIRIKDLPYQANLLIAGVYRDKDHRTVVLQLMALGMLWMEDPRFFKSDRSLKCQATAIFLKGSSVMTTSKWNHKQGKKVSKRLHISTKARDYLGDLLVHMIVQYGAKLIHHWKQEADRKREHDRQIMQAIRSAPALPTSAN